MTQHGIVKLLCNGNVIPAPRNYEDFKYALEHSACPSVILLFGDINILPELLAQAREHKKRVLVHLDLLGGVGKDKAGIVFLARMGVAAVITTKPQLGKLARDAGMLVIHRLFLMDSEAIKTGANLLKGYKPDALELLPASIPASVITELANMTGLPILGGGLMHTQEDIAVAVRNGLMAVSASKRELW
ncbi:glycerol-3-phosphate responsive antiterminator [Sporomusa acidovorans]|uniref:Glycerol uptake operon antiterminator regulatory protein n=1 Tax=Sporomusa acidovorans (strain ATCC 49682 / DSM 3132 / Mol) TaxID=1123286 RepID=A0ABZ3J7A9_SPOA4|nr:glycerol-3-phosphate responsive antiterminator [Sporomusa acidovorans]OZC24062.1 glycerol-3-phosphate responsive antiterminator [Sporomusa acidovorans DSM 3132]SDF59383.1 glycerol uptake operon antiterminator [Sporomusa acidovorans]